MRINEILVEGAPFSYGVVLLGLLTLAVAVVYAIRRSPGLGGLVFGLLAALLAIAGAGIGYGLTFLGAVAGADSASFATFVARSVSCAIAIAYLVGSIGALSSLVATVGGALTPPRRVELALRGASLFVTFATLRVFAANLMVVTEVLVGSDPINRVAIATVGLGEAASVLVLGFGLAALFGIASGIGSLVSGRSPATSAP